VSVIYCASLQTSLNNNIMHPRGRKCYGTFTKQQYRSIIKIGTEPHACREIEKHKTLFMVNMASSTNHKFAPCNVVVVQHGSHSPANSLVEACSLDLRYT